MTLRVLETHIFPPYSICLCKYPHLLRLNNIKSHNNGFVFQMGGWIVDIMSINLTTIDHFLYIRFDGSVNYVICIYLLTFPFLKVVV